MNRYAQFYALTKPRVVQLIVFCAVIGMVLGVTIGGEVVTSGEWLAAAIVSFSVILLLAGRRAA